MIDGVFESFPHWSRMQTACLLLAVSFAYKTAGLTFARTSLLNRCTVYTCTVYSITTKKFVCLFLQKLFSTCFHERVSTFGQSGVNNFNNLDNRCIELCLNLFSLSLDVPSSILYSSSTFNSSQFFLYSQVSRIFSCCFFLTPLKEMSSVVLSKLIVVAVIFLAQGDVAAAPVFHGL